MADSAVSLTKVNLSIFIFSYIKDYIDSILPYDENVCYSENPLVDVKTIAESIGIGSNNIIYTSFEEEPEVIAKKYGIKNIQQFVREFSKNEHAFLIENNNEFLIFVNSLKSEEEQRFSIAHEIEHYISKKIAKNMSKNNYLPSFLLARAIAYMYLASAFKINNKISPKQILLPDKTVIKNLIEQLPKNNETIKRRGDYLEQLKSLEKKESKNKEFFIWGKVRIVSAFIASDMTILFNKHISDKKTYAILLKHLKLVNKKNKVNSALYNTISEIIEEEIADYFAANLLVPTELLTLWEDKSDNKIANAFGVPIKCIKKRRKYEIEQELRYSTSEYLSSCSQINTSVPLIPNESTSIVGGHNTHDAGRG
jgi:Zn-dependent peptidase ImmA (M78 family)